MTLSTFLLIINCFLIFLGLLLNLFIVMMNITWWLKGKVLQPIDIIMTSLGSARIVLLIIYLFLASIIEMLTDLVGHSKNISSIIAAILFVAFCSLWWGTILGAFYCVKITTYRNQLFMKLKMNISNMVPWMLIGSMIISFFSSLPCLWSTFSVKFSNISNENISNNVTRQRYHAKFLNLLFINFTGTIIPLFIFCVSIYLLIASVVKHTKNMKDSSGFSKPQLEAHKNAIINMVSFLFLYLIFFVSSHLMFWGFYIKDAIFIFLCCIGLSSYPSLHSILLIVSNAKLKRSVLSVSHAIQSNMFSIWVSMKASVCANKLH
ncbi:taste receptor type 2 member 1-like [Ranitomeya variabilis]|uniref:taste receptor type 2 member 1-like n=1 Tax=Ranitomeya variabilis TaxID=490064 RepID=UPI0040562E29